MRLNWICVVLFGIALTIPASAQIGVYIGTPPPPLRYEQRGPIPGPGYVWIEGYWAPDGHHYRWAAGHWERPPYEGAYWFHLTTITIVKAGDCMKATGIVRTTTGIVGTTTITTSTIIDR